MSQPVDLNAIEAALRIGGEVTGRALMHLTADGQRRVPQYQTVGAAAFDLDPDHVHTGYVLAADLDISTAEGGRVAATMARAVVRLLAERRHAVEFRLYRGRSQRVRPDSDATGPGGGYGLAADRYVYRLTSA